MDEKIAKIPDIARFRYVRMAGDTLKVGVDKAAERFRFIGQGGIEKGRMENVTEAWYLFLPGDTYIRTEIHFADKNILHLNPVVRFDPEEGMPGNPPLATVNVYRTWLYRLMLLATVTFIVLNVILLRRRLIK